MNTLAWNVAALSLVSALAGALLGCDASGDDGEGAGGNGGGGSASSTATTGSGASTGEPWVDLCPGAEVVETHLPGHLNPDGTSQKVVTLCRACDDGCSDAGEPCERYGDACAFKGGEGRCAACCNGETGELRCKPW